MLDIYLPQQPSPLVESPAALVLDVAVGQLTLCHPAALCSMLECFTITCTWLSSPPPPPCCNCFISGLFVPWVL